MARSHNTQITALIDCYDAAKKASDGDRKKDRGWLQSRVVRPKLSHLCMPMRAGSSSALAPPAFSVPNHTLHEGQGSFPFSNEKREKREQEPSSQEK